MADFVDRHLASRRGAPLSVLDLGAMDVNGSYRQFFDDPQWRYRGADAAEGPGVDLVLKTPYAWSGVASDSVDVVVSGQTLEHVRFPWVTMMEITRVLRPGGMVCVLVPSAGYQHRYPVDCFRYYPDGMAALAGWADLEVVESRTDWEPRGDYTDDSVLWQDTRLVARKPVLSGRHAVQNRVKQAALRWVLARHAQRQDARVPVLGPSDH